MNTKVMIPVFAMVTLTIMTLYFYTHPSYQKSIQAKYYYEMGDYTEAYSLAKEAFGLDLYNRMAATVMAGSTTALKYVKYINEGKGYIRNIGKIAENETISSGDKAKIKLICEIMIDSYVKLAPSVVIDKDLVSEAARYHAKFEKLLEKVNSQV